MTLPLDEIKKLSKQFTQEDLQEILQYKQENDDLFDDLFDNLNIPSTLIKEICDTFLPQYHQIPIFKSHLYIAITIKPFKSYSDKEKQEGRIIASACGVTVEYYDDAETWEKILADRANLDIGDYGAEGYSILKSTKPLFVQYQQICQGLTSQYNALLKEVEDFADSENVPIHKLWELIEQQLPEAVYCPLWDLYREDKYKDTIGDA